MQRRPVPPKRHIHNNVQSVPESGALLGLIKDDLASSCGYLLKHLI